MTATRTSVVPTASEPPATVPRFGSTERAVHWVHAVAFFSLSASGLALYLPVLASAIGDRPLLKALHLGTAGLWLTALLALTVGGDHRRLRRTRQELERFTDDDIRWLRRQRGARAGRFNAGQKVHAVLQSALAALFVVTGILLYLGERNTALRFPGTIPVHDACMFAALALVTGHLYLALVHEPTRPALQGMTDGRVDAAFARKHHAAWTPEPDVWRPSPQTRLAGALVLLAGSVATVVLILDTLR
ncbi:cytochrome b/b6 domain-containing protein [Baekduia sp. Peel2402]|uniref:cytochrome b/b6 domain-containing protein n=1 Tax=Baekduia sp. Peel2402 TaxID=3458296 RepID=UPI00403ECEBC